MTARNWIFVGVLAVLACAGPVWGKNVDLVTLPGRDTVQLTIYNSEDITLVKETRYLTLQEGVNKLQFSWAGTLIDPSSVEFRPLEHADQVELIDTTFPGQKPQHLIWNVKSERQGQVKVEVSYFTSGLTWSMDYVVVADPEETALQFRGYVRVYNNSGEAYENARVRLIVGTINLVEKIAELARRTPRPGFDTYVGNGVFSDSLSVTARAAFDAAEVQQLRLPKSWPKGVVKEGLSEYFMFTVEGRETIRNGWSKRMQAVEADDVKFDIVHRMRSHQYGPRPVRLFIWGNDDEHKLGESPLPNGRVRLFRRTGRDTLSFLAEQKIRYVPIKDKIEIDLGPDDLVVYETLKMSTERLKFHFRKDGRKEFVDGWDERQTWLDTIRNDRDKPIAFELHRRWEGDVDYESEVETSLFDYRTIDTRFSVGARGKKQYPATVLRHHGVNSKQARIHMKAGRTTGDQSN